MIAARTAGERQALRDERAALPAIDRVAFDSRWDVETGYAPMPLGLVLLAFEAEDRTALEVES